MKFDIDYFKNNNVVINCESEKESKELFRILKEYGINEWADSNELNINNTYWDMYKNDTCYEIEFGKSLTYTDCWYYKEEAFDDYEIIKFKDIEFEGEDKMSDNKNKKEYKGWELLKLIDEGVVKEEDAFKDSRNNIYKVRKAITSLYITYGDTTEEVESSILINKTFTKIQKPMTFFEAMNRINEGYKVTNEYNIDNKIEGYWHKNEDNNLAWCNINLKKYTDVGLCYKEINSKWYIYEE